MAVTPYLHAFGIGAVAGSRAMTPAAMLLGGSSGWSRAAKLLAVGELVGDKLPVTPSRLSPPALGARMLAGGASGAAVAGHRGGNRLIGIVFGVSGALVGASLGNMMRSAAAKGQTFPDVAVAAAEDAVALTLCWLITRE